MAGISSKISTRLTKESHASEDVRRHLEKLSRLLTRKYDPNVRFAKHQTAATKLDQDEIEIIVGDHEMEQPATDIQDDAWQLLAREALLIHEIGHVKYTDFKAYDEIRSRIPMQEKQAFHRIYNAAEDAAIDQQLRWKFNCSDELDIHLANLFADPEGNVKHLDLLGAVHVAILEKGVYPTGKLDEWLDESLVKPRYEAAFEEALEMVDDLLVDVMSEPNAEVRYERMFEFWEDLKDLMPEVASQDGGQGDDMSEMIPDDTTGMTPGEDADELEDVDPEDIESVVVPIGMPEEEDDEEEGDHEHSSGDETGDDQEEDEVGGKGSGEEETGEEADSDEDGEEIDTEHYEEMDLGKHEDHNVVVTD